MAVTGKSETRVGAFAALILGLFVITTLKIGEGSTFSCDRGYDVHVNLHSAMGLNEKTPVELAGISVGFVKSVELGADGRSAEATIRIRRGDVRLPEGTKATVKSRGFLGDSFIDLIPGDPAAPAIPKGGELAFERSSGDFTDVVGQFGEIASDVKEITTAMKTMIVGENAPVQRGVNNLDRFADIMRQLVEQNQRNVDTIAHNFADLSQSLRALVAQARPDVEESMSRIASITRKIDEGNGTIGQLVNNPEPAKKITDAADALSDTLGGFRRMQAEIGYHSEYLSATKNFKHYVHLNLRPRPDEALMLEFVEDRDASPDRASRTTTITSGGTTSTVTTDTATIQQNKFRLSAQLAKKFYDFTVRGGLIESRGGIGLDYEKGPLKMSVSAFDMGTKNGQKPHLKFWGTYHLTPALYFMGGADDPMNPAQKTDWFVGAGIQFVDEDLKSILASGAASSVAK